MELVTKWSGSAGGVLDLHRGTFFFFFCNKGFVKILCCLFTIVIFFVLIHLGRLGSGGPLDKGGVQNPICHPQPPD